MSMYFPAFFKTCVRAILKDERAFALSRSACRKRDDLFEQAKYVDRSVHHSDCGQGAGSSAGVVATLPVDAVSKI